MSLVFPIRSRWETLAFSESRRQPARAGGLDVPINEMATSRPLRFAEPEHVVARHSRATEFCNSAEGNAMAATGPFKELHFARDVLQQAKLFIHGPSGNDAKPTPNETNKGVHAARAT